MAFEGPLSCVWTSQVPWLVKNKPAMQETWVWSLGWEDVLEDGMTIHSRILAWRIPWTERAWRGYSPWSHKGPDTTKWSNHHSRRRHWVMKWRGVKWRKDKFYPMSSSSHSCEVKLLSRVRLFATPRTAASTGFSRKDYWSGLPCPSPGDLPNPGTEPRSPTLQADALPSGPPGKPILCRTMQN